MSSNIIEIPRPPMRGGRTNTPALPAPPLADHSRRPPARPPLPDGLGFTEHAAAALRAYLDAAALDEYRVFYNYAADFELMDLDDHLDALGEHSGWAPLPSLAGGSTNMANVQVDRDGAIRAQLPGCIHLRRHEIVLARWFWVNIEDDSLVDIWLCAAPAFEHYVRLRDELRKLRHARTAGEWRIVRGYGPSERVRRETATGDLMLTSHLRARIDAEVVRFFSDEAAALFAAMRVPYRRGVLMHGPPGNGKTSLIRHIGERLPRVPGLILRPAAGFDTDDLTVVVRRWTTQAPGILVIEDLDWLLKEVEVSTFLNLIDSVESSATGGLLLIATTNHPEKLDPAINNRPGRFDVVIEVPPPEESLRLDYLRQHLPATSDAVIRRVASDADGLAFAHLEEIVRLSGLLAISAGRPARSDDDVRRAAAQTVRDAYDQAVRGFPPRPEVPFGLLHVQKLRESEE